MGLIQCLDKTFEIIGRINHERMGLLSSGSNRWHAHLLEMRSSSGVRLIDTTGMYRYGYIKDDCGPSPPHADKIEMHLLAGWV